MEHRLPSVEGPLWPVPARPELSCGARASLALRAMPSPDRCPVSLLVSATSLSESDSENEGKPRGSDAFNDVFRADSLVEGTSSRYSMYNSVSQKLMVRASRPHCAAAPRWRAAVCVEWKGELGRGAP